MPLQPNPPQPRLPVTQAQPRTVPVALGSRLSVANPINHQHIICTAPVGQVTRIAGQPVTTHVVTKPLIPKQNIQTVSIGQTDTPVTSTQITHLLSSGPLVNPLGQHVNLSQAPQRVTIQAVSQHQPASTTVSTQPVALTLTQASTTHTGITHGTQHVGIVGSQMASLICPTGKTGTRLTSQPTQLLHAFPAHAPRASSAGPKPIPGNIVRATATSTQPPQTVLSHLSTRGPVITPIRTIARPNSPAVTHSGGLSITVPSSQVDGQKFRTLTTAEMSLQPRSVHQDPSAAPRPVISHGGATKTIQLAHHPQKIVMTTTTVTTVAHPSITVAITKSVASQIVASALLPSSVVSSTASLTQSIPIAKVTPQRQLISQMDSGSVTTTAAPVTTTLYLPPRPSTTTTPVTSTATSTVSTEAKSETRMNPMIYSIGGQYEQQQYQNLSHVYSSLAQTSQRQALVSGPGSGGNGGNISVTGNLSAGVQAQRLNQVVVMDPNRHIQVRTSGSTQIQAVHLPVPTQPVTQAQSPSHTVTQSPGAPPTASPRPSILRKRTNEGYPVGGKRALPFSLDAGSPRHERAGSPKPLDQQREASQSSTDTASSVDGSNNSTPTTDVKVKLETGEVEALPLLRDGTSSVEASPRKKPRKQLLQANEELKDEPPSSSSDDDDLSLAAEAEVKEEEEDDEMKEEIKEERIDEEGIRWVPFRKRNDYQLMNHYACTWKTKNNHFLRHADVRPKDERRPTVNELSNQKHIHQKTSGWKLYHLAAQLDDLTELETDVKEKMVGLQAELAPDCNRGQYHGGVMDDEMMIHELTQANIQRSQLIVDQIKEAKQSMLSLLEHKTKISEIVQKNRSKRPVKTKARL